MNSRYSPGDACSSDSCMCLCIYHLKMLCYLQHKYPPYGDCHLLLIINSISDCVALTLASRQWEQHSILPEEYATAAKW